MKRHRAPPPPRTEGNLPFDCPYLTTKGHVLQPAISKKCNFLARLVDCISYRVPAIWMTWLDVLRQGLSHWAATYLHITFIFSENVIFLHNSAGGGAIKWVSSAQNTLKHEGKDGCQWRILEALPSVKGGTTKYREIEYQNRCHVLCFIFF